MANFTPLVHQKAPAAVLAQLRRAILSGALPAGTQLREAHIADEMSISRSPVREALSRLEEEGLVEKIPFRGAFVASVSAETIAEIAGIRTQLEPYAITLAVPRLSDADWESLRHILGELDRATSPDTAIERHLAFHRFFYEHSGNRMLLSMWSDWESKLRLFFIKDHESFESSRAVAGVHEELMSAIASGDPEAISAAVADHVHGAPDVATDNSPAATGTSGPA